MFIGFACVCKFLFYKVSVTAREVRTRESARKRKIGREAGDGARDTEIERGRERERERELVCR